MKYIGNGNVIELKTTKEFAIITCKEDGILIECQDTVYNGKDKLVYRLGYVRKMIFLPLRVMEAYHELSESFMIEIISEDKFWIAAKKCKKLYAISPISNNEKVDYNECELNAVKNLKYGKFSMSYDCTPGMMAKVEIFVGNQRYARITSVNRIPKDGFTLKELKEEYGANFLAYPYDSICYYIDFKNNATCKRLGYANAIQLPVPFIRKWKSDVDGKVELYRHKDGSIIISPLEKKCEIDGEKIIPMEEAGSTIHACEQCAGEDKDEIKEILMMIKNITNMCTEIKKNNASLKGRIERLEAALL